MENNKGKYLKYAIGEIVLVVVGILIALQLNNLNERHKNKNLVNNYIENLIENLSMDSINIGIAIRNIEEDLKNIENFEDRVVKSVNPLDTILRIARYEYNFKISVNIDYAKETYGILNTTGHLALFTPDVIQDLNEIYNLQEKAVFNTNITIQNYLNNLSFYSRKYPFTFKNNLIKNGTVAADKVWNNISLLNHATEFNSLIITKSDSYRLSLDILPIIRDKTNNLLDKLRNQKK